MPFRSLLGVSALALLAGCRSAPDPLPPPALVIPEFGIDSKRWVGSSLSGPLEGSPEDLRQLGTLRVQWFAVERLPIGSLPPLGPEITAFLDASDRKPIRATSPVAKRGAIVPAEDAQELAGVLRSSHDPGVGIEPFGRFQELCLEENALFVGTTVDVSLSLTEVFDDPEDFLNEFADQGPFERRLGVQVGGESERAIVAIVLEDLADSEADARVRHSQAELLPVQPTDLRRDLALVAGSLEPSSGPLVLFLPSPFDSTNASHFAVILELEPPAAGQGVFEPTELPPAADSQVPDERELAIQSAVAAVVDGDGRRSSLLFLSDAHDAPIAADLALSADDSLLAEFAALLDVTQLESEAGRGWFLEHTAVDFLGGRLAANEHHTTSRAILLRQAGQVGALPGLLRTIAASAGSLDVFHERLIQENLNFLEDFSPSARLRAFDWLVDKEAAPAGYDPLASREERTSALDIAREKKVEDR